MAEPSIPEWTLGERLNKSMTAAGLTVEEMAELLLRHPNTIYNWLAGRTSPRPRVLPRWAEITHVPLAWLEGGDAPSTKWLTADHRHLASVQAMAA